MQRFEDLIKAVTPITTIEKNKKSQYKRKKITRIN